MTPEGKKAIEQTRQDAIDEVIKMTYSGMSAEGAAQSEALRDRATLQQTLLDNVHKMSEEELKYNQLLLDGNKALQDRYIQSSKQLDKLQDKSIDLMSTIYTNAKGQKFKNGKFNKSTMLFGMQSYVDEISNISKRREVSKDILKAGFSNTEDFLKSDLFAELKNRENNSK